MKWSNSEPGASFRFDRPGRLWPEPSHLRGPGSSSRTISVVVPARNEAASLPQLVAELTQAFGSLLEARDGLALTGFEVIVVDDGSTDDTPALLREMASEYPELRPIRLEPGAGQSAALFAGIRAARGEWIGMLDADLQNPPAELARLWKVLPGGHDAAFGWRAERKDAGSRRIVSRWANRARRAILRDPILDTGCSVRIVRRSLMARIPAFHGAHRFLGPLLLREGARIVQAPVAHRARSHGKSHYHVWNRSINVLIDLMGVAWLLRRPVCSRARELAPEPAQGLEPAQTAAVAAGGWGSREFQVSPFPCTNG